MFLEYQNKPYIFNTPNFKIDKLNQQEYFYDATTQLIEHGNLKRIIPNTGEVAITYDNGELKIYHRGEKKNVIIIDKETHKVDGFLSTTIQTLVLPSEEKQSQRKKENHKATPEEITLESFTTHDCVSLGAKLIVAYQIIDPEKALSKLGKNTINSHIENIATADMARAIQESSSDRYLKTLKNKPMNSEKNEQPTNPTSRNDAT